MRWNHLPIQGGIYDQHPKLIDEWMILFAAEAEEQTREAERHKREAEAQKAKSARRR